MEKPPIHLNSSTPMRIRVLSDLHLEFSDWVPPAIPADVVVLAGDIDVGTRAIEWAIRHFAPTPVIYVPGNHEYYGESLPKHTKTLRQKCDGTNVHLLDNDAVRLKGVVFLGCTLWTDFELFGGDPRLAGQLATSLMTDYRKIRVEPQYRRLRSLDTCVLHHRSRRWLQAQLDQWAGEQVVVVTHHAPSVRSVPARYATDPLSAAYASHLDDLILSTSPLLWVHGHIHDSFDYVIGDTRVVCNPRGYVPNEPNDTFQADLVLEVVKSGLGDDQRV